MSAADGPRILESLAEAVAAALARGDAEALVTSAGDTVLLFARRDLAAAKQAFCADVGRWADEAALGAALRPRAAGDPACDRQSDRQNERTLLTDFTSA